MQHISAIFSWRTILDGSAVCPTDLQTSLFEDPGFGGAACHSDSESSLGEDTIPNGSSAGSSRHTSASTSRNTSVTNVSFNTTCVAGNLFSSLACPPEVPSVHESSENEAAPLAKDEFPVAQRCNIQQPDSQSTADPSTTRWETHPHGRCAHKPYWKHLRAKQRYTYYTCTFCGVKWRQPRPKTPRQKIFSASSTEPDANPMNSVA